MSTTTAKPPVYAPTTDPYQLEPLQERTARDNAKTSSQVVSLGRDVSIALPHRELKEVALDLHPRPKLSGFVVINRLHDGEDKN
jgi:hypothetical protein